MDCREFSADAGKHIAVYSNALQAISQFSA